MAFITTNEVKSIRKALKDRFGKTMKFSVVKSGHTTVNIYILESTDVDFTRNPEYKSNNIHLDTRANDVIKEINQIAETAPAADGGREWFDESDPMTDYFHTAYYVFVSVGKYEKPYKFNGEIGYKS